MTLNPGSAGKRGSGEPAISGYYLTALAIDREGWVTHAKLYDTNKIWKQPYFVCKCVYIYICIIIYIYHIMFLGILTEPLPHFKSYKTLWLEASVQSILPVINPRSAAKGTLQMSSEHLYWAESAFGCLVVLTCGSTNTCCRTNKVLVPWLRTMLCGTLEWGRRDQECAACTTYWHL